MNDNSNSYGNLLEKYKFTGQERDQNTNYDYMHFRYYSRNIGRFLKPDNVTGSPMNPQNWNLYSYVRGNPVNMNDPTGHAALGAMADWNAMLAKLPSQEPGIPQGEQKKEQEVKEEKEKPPETAKQAEVKVYVVEGGIGHVALSVSVSGEAPTWWSSGGNVPKYGEQGANIEKEFMTQYLQEDSETTKVDVYTVSTDPKEASAVKQQIESMVTTSPEGTKQAKTQYEYNPLYNCSVSVADILVHGGIKSAGNPLMIFPASSKYYYDLFSEKKETYQPKR